MYAGVNGETTNIEITTLSKNSGPSKLHLELSSNSTKVNKNLVYVYSFDNTDTPIKVDEDMEVTISTTDSITTDTTKIKILANQDHTEFFANVKGSGSISVSAQNMKSDTTSITKALDNIQVKLNVAPDVLLENSKGWVIISLTKDGKQYIPTNTLTAYISSSANSVIDVTLNEGPKTFGQGIPITITNSVNADKVTDCKYDDVASTINPENNGATINA